MIVPAWAYAAGGAVIAAVSFGSGWQVNEWRHKAAELKQVEAQAKADAKARDKVDATSATYEGERAAIHQQAAASRTIIREVYRDVKVPADCEPPAAVLRLLDDAIRQSGNTGEPTPAVSGD